MTDRSTPDFGAMRLRLAEMREQTAGVQSDLAALRATGHGGGGLVTATVGGDGRLIDLRIDPSVLDPDDPQTVTDLILAAVGAAHDHAEAERTERISVLTRDLGALLPNIPIPGARRSD